MVNGWFRDSVARCEFRIGGVACRKTQVSSEARIATSESAACGGACLGDRSVAVVCQIVGNIHAWHPAILRLCANLSSNNLSTHGDGELVVNAGVVCFLLSSGLSVFCFRGACLFSAHVGVICFLLSWELSFICFRGRCLFLLSWGLSAN